MDKSYKGSIVKIELLPARDIPALYKPGAILAGHDSSGAITSMICSVDDLEIARMILSDGMSDGMPGSKGGAT